MDEVRRAGTIGWTSLGLWPDSAQLMARSRLSHCFQNAMIFGPYFVLIAATNSDEEDEDLLGSVKNLSDSTLARIEAQSKIRT